MRPIMKRVLKKNHRHLLIFTISMLMIWLFTVIRSEWRPEMHFWNKAFGDAGFIFIILVLFIGAAARLFPFIGGALPWQREIGIWSIIFTLIHVYIVYDGWGEGSLAELFGYTFHRWREQWVLTDPGFALANILGLAALFYGLVLLSTSNRLSVRLLTRNSWKYLQRRSVHFLYILAGIHTAYFLYFHFTAFPRQPPPPNFFSVAFPAMIVFLSIMQSAAFCKVVLTGRKFIDEE